MMDHPSDEKRESHDTHKDNDGPIQKTETQVCENTDESKEEQPDSVKALEDQERNLQSSDIEKEYSGEALDMTNLPPDTKTEPNLDQKMRSIDEDKIKVVETKTPEEMKIPTEVIKPTKIILVKSNGKYNISYKPILESMEDNRKEVTETTCTADSTTNANTIVIDLCDDDNDEISEKADSENILECKIDLKSNDECDSNNKATPEQMEDNNEKKGENVTTTDSNKTPLDTIIIDLCCDDQPEMHVKKDSDIQEEEGGNLSQNEAEKNSNTIPTSAVINLKEIREKTGPIHITESTICSEAEVETSSINDNKKAELLTYNITDENESKEVCELNEVNETRETGQMTGKDLSEAPSPTMKFHPEGVNIDDSNVKDDNLRENGDDKDRIETVSVNIDKQGEASLVKDNYKGTQIETKTEEYQIENFRFKDDIITLQEDYGMDPKQTTTESSCNLEKLEMVSEDSKFTILDESDSEDKQCGASDLILRCKSEDLTQRNTTISEITQIVSKLEEQEVNNKLKTEDSENIENTEHESELKQEVNEKEDIQLVLIKKEIDDDLKHLDKGIKENIPSTIENSENSTLQDETTQELKEFDDNIRMPSKSGSNFLNKAMEGKLSENSNQSTVTAENSTGTNNGIRAEPCSKNVQLQINLDIVKSEEKDNIINTKSNGVNECVKKEGDSKVCQRENVEPANKNQLASVYLNDTPPSLSDSDSNEEFFDAVEYIPEGSATKEISLKIKPSMALLSTPNLNLMNEPIPGPSGISTKKNNDETPAIKSEEEKDENYQEAHEFSSDEDTKFPGEEKNMASEKNSLRDDTLKTKESRKHKDIDDEEENKTKNQKKIKLD